MQILAAVIERFFVEGIGGDTGIPVEAQLAAFRIERAEVPERPPEVRTMKGDRLPCCIEPCGFRRVPP